MHTISFFSFKGGVGRTNLLLNVAYGLARDGHFVVIADWDLHAPGLTTMEQLFPPNLEPSDGNVERPWNVRQGVLDYLDAALDPEAVLPDPATLPHATRLGSNARREQTAEKRIEGDIWFIPAGRFDPRDASQYYHNTLLRVQGRDLAGWLARMRSVKNADPNQSPIAVATYFRDRVACIEHNEIKDIRKPNKPRTPDYLLLDSRTGMTEIGDLVLGAGLAERMVLVTGLNEQNLAGLESVIRDLQNHIRIGELPTHVIIVASPVPEGEEILKKRRLDRLDDRISSLARPTNSDLREERKKETMPRVFEIPYHPFIALQETPILAEIPRVGRRRQSTRSSTKSGSFPWVSFWPVRRARPEPPA